MSCSHPEATITDHTIHGYERESVRYAWRGACLSCQRGVVGVTAIPMGIPADRLNAMLTTELMAYLQISVAPGV